MEIVLGIVFVVILIAVVVGALYLISQFAPRWPAREPRPEPDVWTFDIEPQVICAHPECSAKVVARVTTDQASAAGRITVLMPDNQTKTLANGLVIERDLAGDDPFFDAGLGQHVVRFEATGLRQGSVVGTSDIYLIDSGYAFGHSVRHRFPADTPDADRRQHVDVFAMGEVDGQKDARRVSICKRISLVEVRCTRIEAPPNHPRALAVQVFDAAGTLVAGATMGEDSQLPVPAGEVRSMGWILSTLPAGPAGPFAPDSSVSWSLQLTFACD